MYACPDPSTFPPCPSFSSSFSTLNSSIPVGLPSTNARGVQALMLNAWYCYWPVSGLQSSPPPTLALKEVLHSKLFQTQSERFHYNSSWHVKTHLGSTPCLPKPSSPVSAFATRSCCLCLSIHLHPTACLYIPSLHTSHGINPPDSCTNVSTLHTSYAPGLLVVLHCLSTKPGHLCPLLLGLLQGLKTATLEAMTQHTS